MLIADAKEKAKLLQEQLAKCSDLVEKLLSLSDKSYTDYQILVNSLFSESHEIPNLLRQINKDIHAASPKK